MEQAISTRMGKRSGWSDFENELLWETADEAQRQGLSLKHVFERIAEQTGRRPNSIRNYYYAQVKRRDGEESRTAKFIPFTQDEVDMLMQRVLRARAQGQSVRSCLQTLSAGDHSLMLRYQNKYRSIIKSRPEYVKELVKQLNDEGVMCDAPQVNHRTRADMGAACEGFITEARFSGDIEVARAVETLTAYMRGVRVHASRDVSEALDGVIMPVKQFLALDKESREAELDVFLETLAGGIGALEALALRE